MGGSLANLEHKIVFIEKRLDGTKETMETTDETIRSKGVGPGAIREGAPEMREYLTR